MSAQSVCHSEDKIRVQNLQPLGAESNEKITELSSSSSSSMDEKELEQYVDVQRLIKSDQEVLNKEQVNDVDAISHLITKQFSNTPTTTTTTPTIETKTITDDSIRTVEQVILREPDSTTNDDETQKITKELIDISNKIEKELQQQPQQPQQQQQQQQQQDKQTNEKPTVAATQTTTTTGGCSYCACLDEILTWKDPKISGALLGFLLISLISFATFSLLSIVGFTLLFLMTLIGGYRLYALILFKIKGHSDDTINKFLAMKLSLPKDEIQSVVKFVESNGNTYLNRLKQLVLWEEFTSSGIAYVVLYLVYSLGCVFNTITLLIFLVIVAFTWPKVYKTYKVQIDQLVKKVHDQSVEIISKIKEKVPFLNKKKLQ